jgi:hypothetical protein
VVWVHFQSRQKGIDRFCVSTLEKERPPPDPVVGGHGEGAEAKRDVGVLHRLLRMADPDLRATQYRVPVTGIGIQLDGGARGFDGTLGDFCQITYHLTCLLARLPRRGNSYIVRLCACFRALNTDENRAQFGVFSS